MQTEKLNEIIDFAIQREEEAVVFYQELQSITKFSDKKALLKDLENMERGHIVSLKQLRKKEIEVIEIPEVENLHISDYIVPSRLTSEMSYQDILVTAIKKEEKAYELYNKLAQQADEETIKKIFSKLASEEAQHKHMFEKIYDDEILDQD